MKYLLEFVRRNGICQYILYMTIILFFIPYFIITRYLLFSFFFFFNDTATTEIYTLSLHDALPISALVLLAQRRLGGAPSRGRGTGRLAHRTAGEGLSAP